MDVLLYQFVLLSLLGLSSATPEGSSRCGPTKHSPRGQQRERRKPPNVVFIMADDLGWNDVGFHNPYVKTPHIDELARQGIELTDYHTYFICTPSRGALLTGRYAHHIGLQKNVFNTPANSCLPIDVETMADMFKAQGYTTKMVGKYDALYTFFGNDCAGICSDFLSLGYATVLYKTICDNGREFAWHSISSLKWHLGDCHKDCLPTSRGFDEFRGETPGVLHYFDYTMNSLYGRFVNESLDYIPPPRQHLTLQHGDDIEQMIASHEQSSEPLFMYIAPYAPHNPYIITDEMLSRYNTSGASESLLKRIKYLALVTALDDLIGRAVTSLRRANLYDNTIIIFTSDNGGEAATVAPQFSFVPLLGNEGNNWPWRGAKGSAFEGGSRVPAIFVSPFLLPNTRGTQRDFLMHITDWLPTLHSIITGAPYPTAIDGIDQSSNLSPWPIHCNKYETRAEYPVAVTSFHFPSEDACSADTVAIRYKDWKLIYGAYPGILFMNNFASEWYIPAEDYQSAVMVGDNCQRSTPEGDIYYGCLFNLRDDPLEQHNLYDQRLALAKDLIRRARGYQASRVENVVRFFTPIPLNDETTTLLPDGSRGVKTDFCDSTLLRNLPINPQCYCSDTQMNWWEI